MHSQPTLSLSTGPGSAAAGTAAPGSDAVGAAAPGSSLGRDRSTASAEAQIGQLVQVYERAWNAHDMHRFGALFDAEADVVNVLGTRWRDRQEVVAAHRQSHDTFFRASTLETVDTTIRLLRPDVATVHVRWRLVGQLGPDDEPMPPREGILLHVVVREDDTWIIIASHNTDIIPWVMPSHGAQLPGAPR